MMIRRKKKPELRGKKRRYTATLNRAERLQRCIAEGKANPDQAREYRRIMNVLRYKFVNGMLSAENAQRLGIE